MTAETAGAKFLREFGAEFEVPDTGYRALLETAAGMMDVIESLEDRIRHDGLVLEGSRGQPVAHPLIGEVRQQRTALSRALVALDLDGSGNVSKAGAALARSRRNRR